MSYCTAIWYLIVPGGTNMLKPVSTPKFLQSWRIQWKDTAGYQLTI